MARFRKKRSEKYIPSISVYMFNIKFYSNWIIRTYNIYYFD